MFGAVPAPLLWRIVALVGFAATIWFVVLRGQEVDQAPPSRMALRTYGISVAAMVAAIPRGATIITTILDRPNAVLVWVVFVVGVHFLPFAHAFHLPIFRWLAGSMIVVSIVGAVAVLTSEGATAVGWTSVAAGFVLLFFSALGPRLTRETIQPSVLNDRPCHDLVASNGSGSPESTGRFSRGARARSRSGNRSVLKRREP